MDLGDGSAVRLTVSRYYTPTGRSIQRPYAKGNKDYYDDYLERLNSGELFEADKIKVADSLKYKTPKGKIVYGGGGIIPDVFVPIDNSMENETLSYILRRGLIGNFVFEQLEKNRHAYDTISRNEFINTYELSNDIVFAFEDYLNARSNSKVTFVAYNEEIKQYIKATFADQLYGNGAFEEVYNQRDIMIDEVIKLSGGE
jgi:carboxyl-terminal processing protease